MSTPVDLIEARASLRAAGPGGICDDCGHLACRHQGSRCEFPPACGGGEPCGCSGMLWRGHRIEMDSRTGPLPSGDPTASYVIVEASTVLMRGAALADLKPISLPDNSIEISTRTENRS